MGPKVKGLVANAPTSKPPSESVRRGGERRHAETCRKRGQEGPGKRARGIQRAVNAAFHEATVRGHGDKMERRQESEPERQARPGKRRGPARAPPGSLLDLAAREGAR